MWLVMLTWLVGNHMTLHHVWFLIIFLQSKQLPMGVATIKPQPSLDPIVANNTHLVIWDHMQNFSLLSKGLAGMPRHSYIHTNLHACMHTFTERDRHTHRHTHTDTHTRAHIHTHTHTYTHTNTHTHSVG